MACLPFNLAHDHVRELAAWLAYHRMLGVSLVRVYDWAPVDVARAKRAAFVRLVAPWVASGALAYHRLYPTGPGKTTGTNNDVEELVAAALDDGGADDENVEGSPDGCHAVNPGCAGRFPVD